MEIMDQIVRQRDNFRSAETQDKVVLITHSILTAKQFLSFLSILTVIF